MRILLVSFLSYVGAFQQDEESILRYNFSPQSCENSTIFNRKNLTLSLSRNLNATKCSLGYGMETNNDFESKTGIDRVKSLQSIQSVLENLKERNGVSGVTFSLWIKLSSDTNNMMNMGRIFTVGNPRNKLALEEMDDYYYPLTECDEQQIDLQLSVHKNRLEVMYRNSDTFFETCRRIRIEDLPLQSGIHHVVITLGDNHQQIVLNGQPSTISQDPFDPKLSHWKEDSLLFFFSYPGYHHPSWNGRIYQFSLYGQRWNSTQARLELTQGLPPTEPYALSRRIQINEDAESIPGSHNTEWYRHPNSYNRSSLPSIDLPIGFVDYEIDELLQSLALIHNSTHKLHFYLIRPPSRGDLYDTDGTKLSKEKDLITLLKGNSIIFLPVYNEHSPLPGSTYSSFDFCVTTNQIFTASQCRYTGTIDIVVNSINDPPEAIVTNKPYAVHEGIYEGSGGLKLTGRDVDAGDKIVAIQITSSPQYGYLYLSVPIFREDGLIHGTRLSDLNNTIPGSEVIIEYRYIGSDQVVQGTAATDTFKFRVQDNHGAWSESVMVKIQILPSLNVTSPSVFLVKEEEPTSILVHGRDISGLNRTIGFYVETVPPKEEGILIDETNMQVEQSSILNFTQLNLTFLPTTELCINRTKAKTAFTYRMLAYSNDNQIRSVSPSIVSAISIDCNDKLLSISIDQDYYNINTFDASVSDPCCGYHYNKSSIEVGSCTSAAIISDLRVCGYDTHSEQVLVSISSSHGLLTINREERSHLKIVEGHDEMRQSMSFFVLPMNLEKVLSYLHYQTERPGEDKIQIIVHCGSNKNLIINGMEKLPESSDCVDIVTTIQVKASKIQERQRRNLYRKFPWVSLSFTLTMVCLLKAKGKIRKFLTKKRVMDAHDDELHRNCRWREHYDENSGFYYYENLDNGTVTWNPPLDESFIPAIERTNGAAATRERQTSDTLIQQGDVEEEASTTSDTVADDDSILSLE